MTLSPISKAIAGLLAAILTAVITKHLPVSGIVGFNLYGTLDIIIAGLVGYAVVWVSPANR